MTTKDTILISLSKFQATTAVIAQDLCQPAPIVAAFCEDIEASGLIERTSINGQIDLWQITQAGRERIKQVLDSKQLKSISKA